MIMIKPTLKNYILAIIDTQHKVINFAVITYCFLAYGLAMGSSMALYFSIAFNILFVSAWMRQYAPIQSIKTKAFLIAASSQMVERIARARMKRYWPDLVEYYRLKMLTREFIALDGAIDSIHLTLGRRFNTALFGHRLVDARGD